MKKLMIVMAVLAALVVIACSKKNSPSKTTTAAPAKAPSVTYAGNVKALVQARCAPCHIPSEGGKKKSFDNYDSTSKYINEIVRRIQLPVSVRGYMPFKKDPLSSEEIALFIKWKEEGLAQ